MLIVTGQDALQMEESFKSRPSMGVARRLFLQRTLQAAAALAIGCGTARGDATDPSDTVACEDALAGGKLVRALRFMDEDRVLYDEPQGQGLDGGQIADLSALTQENLLMPNERFFIRTMAPDHLDADKPWSIRVHGLVEVDTTLSMEDLEPLAESRGSFVLECSGNWGGYGFGLLSAASWDGVLIEDLLDMVSPTPNATRLLVSGFDEHSVPPWRSIPGASWIFSFDQLAEAGAFLAIRMNGKALPPDHGAPVRLYVPGWYGCAAIKWVNELRLVGEDEPATAQMREFASRTRQRGTPRLARDYMAALVEQAAMPIRIEQWRVDDATRYRIVGILWGGDRITDRLTLRFNPGEAYVPIDVCPKMERNQPWTLWSHVWDPPAPGRYEMRARVDDLTIPTLRLDQGWYDRAVEISEV